MSRSNNTELINPAKKFIQWDATAGHLKYYDKETKENVPFKLPFTFIVLDMLSTVKGYNKPRKMGYWANEVRNPGKDELTVKTKDGTEATGIWKEIKNNLSGAKFCQSTYIAYKEGDKLVIGNIQLMGSALSAFFDFKKNIRIYDCAIQITSFTEDTSGAIPYNIPVFEVKEISKTSNLEAVERDKEVQNYLAKYFERAGKSDEGRQKPDGDTEVVWDDGVVVNSEVVDEANEAFDEASEVDLF